MRIFLGLLIFSITACQAKSQNNNDIKVINDVFKKYTTAIQNGDGQEAIKYISQPTLNYYDSLIHHTLYSNEADLNKINILSRTAVLRMRHSQTTVFWDTMTAKKLLVKMWTANPPEKTGNQINLANCSITGNTATCQWQINNESTEMIAAFNKEKGEWKIDISSVTDEGIKLVQDEIKRRHISETEYILQTIEEFENKKIPKEKLYLPLKQK